MGGKMGDVGTVEMLVKASFRRNLRMYDCSYFVSLSQCEEKYRNTVEKCELAEQRLAQFQRKAEQLPGVEKQLAERMHNLQQVR